MRYAFHHRRRYIVINILQKPYPEPYSLSFNHAKVFVGIRGCDESREIRWRNGDRERDRERHGDKQTQTEINIETE